VVAVVRSAPLRALVEPVLGGGAFAVRAVLFDKVPAANWRVPWHRDRLVAVRSRRDAPGYSAWSVKDGVVHVEPPSGVLERMLAVRLHLDASTTDNGPLRVLSGSHLDRQDHAIDEASAVTITAARGSALLMRPLLRHASLPAANPGHRRVLHIEFAAHDLPGGLAWHDRI
jgi:ectoine hydroxylase-related dioxygenase (phytanoyl-CoA dioxygenase family)